MLYRSTHQTSPRVSLKEAVLRSMPTGGGLYLPERLPVLDALFWESWRSLSFQDLAAAVAEAFFGEDIPQAALRAMVDEALTFDAPLVTLAHHDHVLELFHGPTLAFKDFGARFMARMMAWLVRDDLRPLTVLVATSGDTGGAVAAAFDGLPQTRVVILFPDGQVSPLQEQQLTTWGENISALRVAGSFDACQEMVKTALLDPDLNAARPLTSANSINLARLVPQSFYYLHAARQLPLGARPVFVVPSGNFGNLTAGLLASRLGLDVAHWIAATNRNDVVPEFLKTGEFCPRPSVSTIANAMDVGNPSNFARVHALFDGSWAAMREQITGMTFDDNAIRDAIRDAHARHGYVLDPHGAIAWLAATAWRHQHPGDSTIALATAHPAKFSEVIIPLLGADALAVPERLAAFTRRVGHALPMPAEPELFLDWLRNEAI